jgi:hypothetical protein
MKTLEWEVYKEIKIRSEQKEWTSVQYFIESLIK